MDLLGYSDTALEVCLVGKTRREVNDLLRQMLLRSDRIRVCPCVRTQSEFVWIRKTLEFLGAHYSNEPSRECPGHGTH